MAVTQFINVGGDAGARDLTAAASASPAGLGLAGGKSYRIQNINEGRQVYWKVTTAALNAADRAALDAQGFVLDCWRSWPEYGVTIHIGSSEHLYFFGPYQVELAVEESV